MSKLSAMQATTKTEKETKKQRNRETEKQRNRETEKEKENIVRHS